MKFAPWAFSMVVSAASGTFAVTSWAVEGLSTPATTSAQPAPIGRGNLHLPDSTARHVGALSPEGYGQKSNDRNTLSPLETHRLASDGADYVGGVKRRGVKEDGILSDSFVASRDEPETKRPDEFHR